MHTRSLFPLPVVLLLSCATDGDPLGLLLLLLLLRLLPGGSKHSGPTNADCCPRVLLTRG